MNPCRSASAAPSFDYIPGLDGLRACAVLLVLTAHLGFSSAIPGGFGVTLFFFISGLLITRLLLAEHVQQGGIAIGRFYLRRLIRLYPALLVAVAVALSILLWSGAILSSGKIAAALLYYTNYYAMLHNFGIGRDGFDPFSILWSLAVEEQYYLIFPLLFVCLLSRNNLRRLFLALVVLLLLILGWRILLHHGGASSDRIYMSTDTRIDSILYGACLAVLLAQDQRHAWRRFCASRIVQGLCLFLLLICFAAGNPGFRDTLRYSLQGLALMPLLTALCFTDSGQPLLQILEKRSARRIGNWSYSLYLYHPIAIAIAEIYWGPGSLGPHRIGWSGFAGFAISTVLLSFGMAAASYYWVEQPMLRWRRRFGAHPVVN